MKKLAIVGLVFTMLGGVASAADLAPAPYIKAPVASPVYDWSGFYIGINAGYSWGNPSRAFLGLPDNPGLWTNYNPVVNGLGNYGTKGFLGGGQLGYNWQSGAVVAGFEADIDYSNIRGTRATTPLVSLGGTPFSFAETRAIDWFATIRGRLGWTPADRLLVYGTGGLAVGGVRDATNLSFVGCPCYVGQTSSTQSGWTVGGGAEWAFASNWSAKVEYLYFDLGSVRVTGNPNLPVANNQTQSDFRNAGNIVRFGLNYRFGGPVVAKY